MAPDKEHIHIPADHFGEIYTKHAPSVFKMCRAYTGDYDQAKDLVQETFIKVWENLPGFRKESSLHTWIYRIAINTCLTHIRNDKKQKKYAPGDAILKSTDDEDRNKAQDMEQLYRAIHRLAETDRLIISMVMEEVPYPDIAKSFQLSEGNLRVKIHRIKQELTRLFFKDE